MPYSHNHEDEIIVFAETNFRNTSQKFGIKTDDRRRHVYILGKTGMGKTTMIENMILEDIYAGHGVGFVDPHGDSSDKILDYIPSHRINDVVYFNPSDVDNPMGFNVLEAVDETHKHLIASGLMGVFKKIWEDQWSARMEYILNNSILALLDYPGSTLLGINRLLSDKEYRKKVISQSKDPVVKAFWVKEFAGYQQKFASEAVAPIQNKVGQFLSASVIRNIVAQVKSTIDIRKIMDEGKIFIMNLSKGKIGEDASRLLGGMLITKLQLSAMERVDMPEPERMDFYLYVDEFQNFATSSFADILSEARKYRLNLILAHQYIAQLDEKVRDAVFGNVGTHIVFRVGAADAAAFEEEFTPVFLPEDLVNLPKFDIYLKLMIDGAASQPFSARTLPPIGSPTGSRDKVINVSRERYSQKRSVIEEKIERWWGFGETEEPATASPPLQGGVRGGGSFGSERGGFSSDRTPYSSSPSSSLRAPYSERGNLVPSRPTSSFPPPSSSFLPPSSSFLRKQEPRPPASSQPATYNLQPKFPAVCDRCGKETTANFKPDPRKPFYCQDCLPLMREKMRLQTSSPPPFAKSAPSVIPAKAGIQSRSPIEGARPFKPSLSSPSSSLSSRAKSRDFTPLNNQEDKISPRASLGRNDSESSRSPSAPGLSLSALKPLPRSELGSTTGARPPKSEKPSPLSTPSPRHPARSDSGDAGSQESRPNQPPSRQIGEGEKVEL